MSDDHFCFTAIPVFMGDALLNGSGDANQGGDDDAWRRRRKWMMIGAKVTGILVAVTLVSLFLVWMVTLCEHRHHHHTKTMNSAVHSSSNSGFYANTPGRMPHRMDRNSIHSVHGNVGSVTRPPSRPARRGDGNHFQDEKATRKNTSTGFYAGTPGRMPHHPVDRNSIHGPLPGDVGQTRPARRGYHGKVSHAHAPQEKQSGFYYAGTPGRMPHHVHRNGIHDGVLHPKRRDEPLPETKTKRLRQHARPAPMSKERIDNQEEEEDRHYEAPQRHSSSKQQQQQYEEFFADAEDGDEDKWWKEAVERQHNEPPARKSYHQPVEEETSFQEVRVELEVAESP